MLGYHRRNVPLYSMMKDKFGNYVVQKAVEFSRPPLQGVLVQKINSVPTPNSFCTWASFTPQVNMFIQQSPKY